MNKKSRKKSFSLLKKISYKEFKGSLLWYVITVFSCVAIIVMGTGMLAYATTSIGENIITNILTATGLTVNGNATTTGTLNVEGGITGNLTGNVIGDLTGTSTNAEQLGNVFADDYSTDTERTNALADYMALSGGTISGNLNVSGNTVLATTSLATTTISGSLTAKTGRTATFVIAASNSSAISKAQADYVCDGVDDNIQIQAAIDALPNAGGKIYFHTGTYVISETIINEGKSGTNRHIYFLGNGFWNTKIKLADGANTEMIINGGGTDYCVGSIIDGFQFNGNQKNQTEAHSILKFIDCSKDSEIRHVFINYSKGHGVEINSAWSLAFIDSSIEYNEQDGIHIKPDANQVTNIEFAYLTMHSNRSNIYHEKDGGYFQEFIIHGCNFGVNSNESIRLGQLARWGRIYDNHISNSAQEGITLNSDNSYPINNISIHNNIITANTGILLNGFRESGIIIVDNDLEGCTTPIVSSSGKWIKGLIKNNLNYNPIGIYSTPFGTVLHYITPVGNDSNPVASEDYTIQLTPCRIISTGGTNVDITIKDKDENIISNPGSTCDELLEPSWKINWGAFSETPSVKIIFK